MIKKIIIRVIVAVFVTFILSKLRLLGFMQVNALEYYNVLPDSISIYWSDNQVNTVTGLSNYNDLNTFYKGYSFNSNLMGRVKGLSFNYENYYALPHKRKGVANFVIFTTNSSDSFQNPFRVYIKDCANNITSCRVESAQNNRVYDGQGEKKVSYVNTVTCENVSIQCDFKVVMGDDFSARGTFGISNFTYQIDSVSDINNTLNNQLEEQKEQTKQQKETNGLIKNDNVDSASSEAETFFDDFDSEDYGLKDVVLAPVSFIESLLNYQCQPLRFPLPFVNEDVVLPCMSTIYSQYPTFYTLWQMITTGMICYYVCLNIFGKIKQLTDPLNDRIEVIQL